VPKPPPAVHAPAPLLPYAAPTPRQSFPDPPSPHPQRQRRRMAAAHAAGRWQPGRGLGSGAAAHAARRWHAAAAHAVGGGGAVWGPHAGHAAGARPHELAPGASACACAYRCRREHGCVQLYTCGIVGAGGCTGTLRACAGGRACASEVGRLGARCASAPSAAWEPGRGRASITRRAG